MDQGTTLVRALKNPASGAQFSFHLELSFHHEEWQTGSSATLLRVDTRQGHLRSNAKAKAFFEATVPGFGGSQKVGETEILNITEGFGRGGAWSQSRHGLFQGENLGHMHHTGQVVRFRSEFEAHAKQELNKFATLDYVRAFAGKHQILDSHALVFV